MGEEVIYMGLQGFLHGGRAITHVNRVYLGEGSFPPCKQGLAGGREFSPYVNWFKLVLGAIPHVNQHLHAASHVKVD